MTRRISPRRPRRVQVQFWKRDEPHAYPGYTTNISMTGMFIATRSPYPPGTRLRVEVLEGERGFVIEGIVAHARKVRGELMRLSTPGMGVRFMTVEELIRELIPAGYGVEDLPGAPPPAPPVPSAPNGPPAAAQAVAEQELDWTPPPMPAPSMPSMSSPRPAPLPSPPPPSSPPPASPPARPAPASPPIPTPREGGGTFSVYFLSPAEFVEVFRRDIVNGGLFVSTRYPGRLQETVSVELHPPFPGAAPVLVRARVVQRFEPSSEAGPNLLSGMGVELLELPAVVEKLRPWVEGK